MPPRVLEFAAFLTINRDFPENERFIGNFRRNPA